MQPEITVRVSLGDTAAQSGAAPAPPMPPGISVGTVGSASLADAPRPPAMDASGAHAASAELPTPFDVPNLATAAAGSTMPSPMTVPGVTSDDAPAPPEDIDTGESGGRRRPSGRRKSR